MKTQYVVTDEKGFVMEIYYGWYESPRGGLLAIGDCGTLFSSRRTARAAIERSRIYSEKFRLMWNTSAMKVQAVR